MGIWHVRRRRASAFSWARSLSNVESNPWFNSLPFPQWPAPLRRFTPITPTLNGVVEPIGTPAVLWRCKSGLCYETAAGLTFDISWIISNNFNFTKKKNLENVGKYNFFRQLWLVLGVKLMEINVATAVFQEAATPQYFTGHLSHEKKHPARYFPLNPGWLIGILISWFMK